MLLREMSWLSRMIVAVSQVSLGRENCRSCLSSLCHGKVRKGSEAGAEGSEGERGEAGDRAHVGRLLQVDIGDQLCVTRVGG